MKYNKEELERLIITENKSYSYIGRIYNVNGNSIKKAAKKKLGITLKERRKVNQNENFSHKKKTSYSLVNKLTDEEFIQIINYSKNWKTLESQLWYKSKTLSQNVRNSIYERCTKLGIVLDFHKVKETDKRTNGEIFKEFKNWQSARSFMGRYAQKRYNESCKDLKCAICGYNKHVEIVHIKAVSDFLMIQL